MGPVGEGPWPQSRHERRLEVGHRHSTEEGGEQGRGRPAEPPEGRPLTKENPQGQSARGTQSPAVALDGPERIRRAAKGNKTLRFNNLLHHMTVAQLHRSYRALSRNAAPGVDDLTWREYGEGLSARIADLHSRVQGGRYRAQPSKRIYIPKADGRMRPIGIAALEDKIVQHAAAQVLSAIWEADFAGFSHGFRPGRKQHDALDALYVALTKRKVNWVLDADIRGFFDNLDHDWLMKFVAHRVADERMLSLIRRWLRAGVSEEGEWAETIKGTPQGAVISPILANIYLHYVLDLWIKQWRQTKARGEVYIVRYADDFVMGFQHCDDAKRLLVHLRERLAKFGLELHPEKTRLIQFGRFAAQDRERDGLPKPETFNFLGFTHYCGKTRQGRFTVGRLTMSKRLQAKAKEVRETLMRMRHRSVKEMGMWLRSVLRGYFRYHAVPGNIHALDAFRTLTARAWLAALRRRSQRARRTLAWDRVQKLYATWLPQPKILHPYPTQRLVVNDPR